MYAASCCNLWDSGGREGWRRESRKTTALSAGNGSGAWLQQTLNMPSDRSRGNILVMYFIVSEALFGQYSTMKPNLKNEPKCEHQIVKITGHGKGKKMQRSRKERRSERQEAKQTVQVSVCRGMRSSSIHLH